MKSEAPIFETITPGQYYADFIGISEFKSEFGQTFRWAFNVYVEDQKIEMSDLSSSGFTPNAKARKWAECMLGRTIEGGEIVDYDDLIGTRVLLVLGINDGGYNKIELMTKPEQPAPAAQPVENPGQPGNPAPSPLAPEQQPILVAGDQKQATSGPAAQPPPPPPPPPAEDPPVPPDEAPF